MASAAHPAHPARLPGRGLLASYRQRTRASSKWRVGTPLERLRRALGVSGLAGNSRHRAGEAPFKDQSFKLNSCIFKNFTQAFLDSTPVTTAPPLVPARSARRARRRRDGSPALWRQLPLPFRPRVAFRPRAGRRNGLGLSVADEHGPRRGRRPPAGRSPRRWAHSGSGGRACPCSLHRQQQSAPAVPRAAPAPRRAPPGARARARRGRCRNPPDPHAAHCWGAPRTPPPHARMSLRPTPRLASRWTRLVWTPMTSPSA